MADVSDFVEALNSGSQTPSSQESPQDPAAPPDQSAPTPLNAGSQENRPAPTDCDLIMRGGITSGIVYPSAIAELAKTFRLRSIGGTSAGAIAAAGAAAAAYGARTGSNTDAFVDLAALPGTLTEPIQGKSALEGLFQPEPRHRSLLTAFKAVVGRPKPVGKALAMLGAFPLMALLGAVLFLLPALLLVGLVWRESLELTWATFLEVLGLTPVWVTLVASIPLALIGALLAVVGRVGWMFFKGLPKTRFGLCSGFQTAPKPDGPTPLTNWMHEQFQDLAKPPGGRPLTMGDLWGAQPEGDPPDDPQDDTSRSIDLVLMSTDLSYGVSRRFPTLERHKEQLCFVEAVFRELFPADVVDHLVANRQALDPEFSDVTLPAGVHRLPPAKDLPILLGARLSLSFPVLLQAVPLISLTLDESGDESGGRDNPSIVSREIWLSDGGLVSNFPIHVFDAPIPGYPTFGINLLPTDAPIDPDDPKTQIWLPIVNGQHAKLPPVGPKPSMKAFGTSLMQTARNWADTELMGMPGYQDRVVHVLLADHEGGLNLDMPKPVIDALVARGTVAGQALVSRFAEPSDAVDPIPKGEVEMGWDNHQWVRYRSISAAHEGFLRRFARTWQQKAVYKDMAGDSLKKVPSYPWASEKHRDLATATTDELVKVHTEQAQQADGGSVFDREGSEAPKPPVVLRTMPSSGG